MKTFTFLFLACIAALGTTAQTVITITDASLQPGQTYNWTNNNIYLLDGFVFVENGAVLNIQEGTVIKGKETPTNSDNASALIITVGGKINAVGTASQPIIFTTDLDDVNDPNDLDEKDNNLWGGVIILGDGILGNSTPTAQIEGIPTTEPRGSYGGNNNAHNGGTLKYVSIRHGGAEIGAGNEINGLTLGGVGSGTVLEYIEVFSNQDDGIEFFGGAVNLKYAVAAFCGDDAFDWDLGWVGKGQFWFGIQRADEGDHGGEFDGAKPDANSIFANPTIYNATFIGAGTSGTAANTNGLIFRDATAGTIANSIITDFAKKALEVEDLPAASGIDSRQRLENGDLNLLNNIWFGFGGGNQLNAGSNGILRATANAEDPNAQFLITHLNANNNSIVDPGLYGISRTNNGNLDPRPSATGPAYQSLATYPSDNFFTPVTYKGAFSSGDATWMHGWTALSQMGYLKNVLGIENGTAAGLNMTIAPNPANGMTAISFTLSEAAEVSVELVDITGKVVAEITTGKMDKGANTITVNTAEYNAGIYFCVVKTASGQATQKLIVQ